MYVYWFILYIYLYGMLIVLCIFIYLYSMFIYWHWMFICLNWTFFYLYWTFIDLYCTLFVYIARLFIYTYDNIYLFIVRFCEIKQKCIHISAIVVQLLLEHPIQACEKVGAISLQRLLLSILNISNGQSVQSNWQCFQFKQHKILHLCIHMPKDQPYLRQKLPRIELQPNEVRTVIRPGLEASSALSTQWFDNKTQ